MDLCPAAVGRPTAPELLDAASESSGWSIRAQPDSLDAWLTHSVCALTVLVALSSGRLMCTGFSENWPEALS